MGFFRFTPREEFIQNKHCLFPTFDISIFSRENRKLIFDSKESIAVTFTDEGPGALLTGTLMAFFSQQRQKQVICTCSTIVASVRISFIPPAGGFSPHGMESGCAGRIGLLRFEKAMLHHLHR